MRKLALAVLILLIPALFGLFLASPGRAINTGWIGQSLSEHTVVWGYATTANGSTSMFEYGTDSTSGQWNTPTFSMARFLNRINDNSGQVANSIMGADGGAAVTYHGYFDVVNGVPWNGGPPPGYWNAPSIHPYPHWLGQIANSGVTPDVIIFHDGEQDGLKNVPQAEVEDAIASIMAQMRSDIGNSTLPFIVIPQGKRTTANGIDAWQQQVRDGLLNACEADEYCYPGPTTVYHDTRDGVHYTNDSYSDYVDQVAQPVLFLQGATKWYRNPRIVRARKLTDSSILLRIQHGGGTALLNTPTFTVGDDSGSVTVSATTAKENHHYLLTLGRTLDTNAWVCANYGTNPSAPYGIDNSELSMPVESRTVFVEEPYGN